MLQRGAAGYHQIAKFANHRIPVEQRNFQSGTSTKWVNWTLIPFGAMCALVASSLGH